MASGYEVKGEGNAYQPEQRQRLSKIDIGVTYDLLEKEADGTVSPPVLQKSLQNLGLHVTTDECDNIYNEVTADGTCPFDQSSFESWVEQKEPDLDPQDVPAEAFAALDKDCNGFLNIDDFKAGLPPLGINISDNVLNIMFTEADKDEDGRIGYEDFLQILNSS